MRLINGFHYLWMYLSYLMHFSQLLQQFNGIRGALTCKAWPCPCQVSPSRSTTCTGARLLRRASRSPRVFPCLTCIAWVKPLPGVTAVMTRTPLPDLKHRCMRTWRWVEMAPVEVAQNLTVTSRKVMNPTVMSLWEVPVEMEKIMEPWHHLGVTRGEIHSENTLCNVGKYE